MHRQAQTLTIIASCSDLLRTPPPICDHTAPPCSHSLIPAQKKTKKIQVLRAVVETAEPPASNKSLKPMCLLFFCTVFPSQFFIEQNCPQAPRLMFELHAGGIPGTVWIHTVLSSLPALSHSHTLTSHSQPGAPR